MFSPLVFLSDTKIFCFEFDCRSALKLLQEYFFIQGIADFYEFLFFLSSFTVYYFSVYDSAAVVLGGRV
jgi:hypothetical protein